jgi:hypothetical protein
MTLLGFRLRDMKGGWILPPSHAKFRALNKSASYKFLILSHLS